MKNNFIFQTKARSAASNAVYLPVEEFGLNISIEKEKPQKCSLAQEFRLHIKNDGDQVFVGVVHLEMIFESLNPKFFMPAFMYNRNRGNASVYYNQKKELSPFPRISLEQKQCPYSAFWQVRSDRLSHPVSIAVDRGTVYGISIDPLNPHTCKFNGFSCRMGEQQSSVGVTLGYENAPWLYVSSNDIEERQTDIMPSSITLLPQQKETFSFSVFCFEVENELAINKIIREIYQKYHESPRICSTVKRTVEDISHAIYSDAYVENMKTYSTRVYLKNGIIEQEAMASISWTGGVEVAGPMLFSAARLQDELMRKQALVVVNHIVNNSINPKSHLPFDAFDENHWYVEGWWDECLSESGHSSYLVGQALYYILLSYEIEKKYFCSEHPLWLNFVENCLSHIETTKNEQGEVPHIWSVIDGGAREYDSFSGCWCVAAAAYFDALTGNEKYLKSSEKSLHHYYDTYVAKMECYGTPHDTFKAIDSEGILSFIKASRILHEISGKDEYLKMLSDALEYEFTFKFCWNPPIQANPLKRLGWSSCGGSVTSTCNPHIHPMSNNVSNEIAYCYLKTHDEYFKQRLIDTTKWALQTYSTVDDEYDYGKKGWISERFCYSQGLLVEKYSNGEPCSTWRCFLPWGASNILEGLCGTVWDILLPHDTTTEQ